MMPEEGAWPHSIRVAFERASLARAEWVRAGDDDGRSPSENTLAYARYIDGCTTLFHALAAWNEGTPWGLADEDADADHG